MLLQQEMETFDQETEVSDNPVMLTGSPTSRSTVTNQNKGVWSKQKEVFSETHAEVSEEENLIAAEELNLYLKEKKTLTLNMLTRLETTGLQVHTVGSCDLHKNTCVHHPLQFVVKDFSAVQGTFVMETETAWTPKKLKCRFLKPKKLES